MRRPVLRSPRSRGLRRLAAPAVLALAACVSPRPHARAVEEVRRGYAHLAAGDRERAEVAFEHALEMAPSLGEARNGLGVALRAAGRPAEALAQFDAAVAADPDLAEAHGGRAEALLALGDERAALAAVEDALRIDPDQVAPRLVRARLLARRAEASRGAERALLLERARRDLLHAAEARPRLALVHHDLGWVAWLQGDPERAAQSYRRAATLDPTLAEAWLGACASLAALGREGEAARACDRCAREAASGSTAALRCSSARKEGAPALAGAP
jgi:tetratricopeptide (TPR) repeat protein